MPPVRIIETNYNHALAEQLSWRLPLCDVIPQATGLLERTQLQPDVYIELPSGFPVILECKYDLAGHAKSVEAKALERLGLKSQKLGREVQVAIAVLYPAELRSHAGSQEQALATADLKYAVFTNRLDGPARFPAAGWLQGGLDSLANLVENMAVAEQPAADLPYQLERAIITGAGWLTDKTQPASPTEQKLGEILRLAPGERTTRTAVTIILNALVFHSSVAANYSGILSPDQLVSQANKKRRSLAQSDVLGVWDKIIEEINYGDVFAIATDLLRAISDDVRAPRMLHSLVGIAKQQAELAAQTAQDVAGQALNRLTSGEALPATRHTLPPAAALLAALAADRLSVDLADQQTIEGLRIADFACGSGGLLAAAYRELSQRAKRYGLDDEKLHKFMLEDGLIGADSRHAAVHLTVAALSAMHPITTYGRTRFQVVPYGHQPDGSFRVGTWQRNEAAHQTTLWDDTTLVSASDSAELCEPAGSSAESEVTDQSLDLVIMNPPRTGSTNLASQQTGQGSTARTAAGFIELGLAKLKPTGVLALVLPVSFSAGITWQHAREIIARECADITIISLASANPKQQSFSAGATGAEILLVATRRERLLPAKAYRHENWNWVNLASYPETIAAAAETAAAIGHTQQGAVKMAHRTIGRLVSEEPRL